MGSVYWEEQPSPFKPEPQARKIPLADLLHQQAMGIEPLVPPFAANLPWLAHLLHHTGGITAKVVSGEVQTYLRANPSAGGLFPIEIYAIVQKSDTLEAGIYLYHPLHLALYEVASLPSEDELAKIFLNHPAIEHCPLILVYTAMFSRGTWRYKERTYRRMLLDCGHALGNTIEMTSHYHVHATLMSGFVDTSLGKILDCDVQDEVPLIAMGLSSMTDLQPLERGLVPSELPIEAVKRTNREQHIQQQQNTCEQIPAGALLRKPILLHEHIAHTESSHLPVPTLISHRRSCREMNGDEISLEALQQIMGWAYRDEPNIQWNLCPDFLDTHLVVLRVSDMIPGIYRWDALQNKGLLRLQGDFQAQTYQFCLGQELAAAAALIIVHTVRLPELIDTFGDRGYRYASLTAGIIGQRVNLICGHLGLGASGIGGYFDDETNTCLELPLQEAIVYITAVGQSG